MARITVQRDNGNDNYSKDNAVRISLDLSLKELERFTNDIGGWQVQRSDVTQELFDLLYPNLQRALNAEVADLASQTDIEDEYIARNRKAVNEPEDF